MKFTLNHSRAVTGNDISVDVEADDGQTIQEVETKLDGFSIGDDELETPGDSYQRTFLGAGDAASGAQHTLVVLARQDDGKVHSSTCVWSDPN